MKNLKVYLHEEPKPLVIKDIVEVSLVNGALEVWGNRQDEKKYDKRQVVAGFASGAWKYFEEA